jgi:mRNA interferase YafQ
MLSETRTSKFKKDFKLMQKRNKDIWKLITVMYLIVNEIPLLPVYKEHPLYGNYEGTLECHIEPDWLLIYEIDDSHKIVRFMRTGTHSDLF